MLKACDDWLSIQLGLSEVNFEETIKAYFEQTEELKDADYKKYINIYNSQSDEGKMIMRFVSPITFLNAIKGNINKDNSCEVDINFIYSIEVAQNKSSRVVGTINNINHEILDIYRKA